MVGMQVMECVSKRQQTLLSTLIRRLALLTYQIKLRYVRAFPNHPQNFNFSK
ncbi:MAG: hypothetical protein AAFY72_01965 [Cyanobacteria bacterium J06649_4]